MRVPQPTLDSLRRWDPEQIGPYTLLGCLGAGAMGQVYLGRSMAGRLVAVKTIKVELAEEPGFRARFAREVAAARRVSGVFTASVVAADPEADVPWLATAYIPAPSLSRLVHTTGPLPVETIRWLAAGCAEALESIHIAGLVHRDLKPSNVLVAPDGPRVIDFGVARAAERIQLTVTRGAIGTPAYMAPEQARDSQHASLASDVYSLGATLLFAATGHAPHQGETVMDVLVKLATEPPDLTGLPPDLAGIVTACLERSPRKRPTSAALLAQLGSFVEASADPSDEHTYLTDEAMSLIGEYQRSPQPVTPLPRSSGSEAGLDDPTSASHTALPASILPPSGKNGRNGQAGGRRRRPGADGAGPGGAAPEEQAAKATRRRNRMILIGSGAVAAAAALVTGGAFLGAALSPAQGKATTSADTNQFPPGPPPTALPNGTSTKPELNMGQPEGDPVTVFVVHGSGFVPGTDIRVSLAGHGTSPIEPEVDPAGTFNYAIDQDHEFFKGQIPVGRYEVIAAGPNGRKATAHFTVIPPPPKHRGGAPSSPGGPPPSGNPPPQGVGTGVSLAQPQANGSPSPSQPSPSPSSGHGLARGHATGSAGPPGHNR